jgi:hypothetical protein
MANGDRLYDTGWLDGTTQAITLPWGIIKDGTTTYYVEVRAIDDIERETLPGHPAYVSAGRTFTYAAGATTGVTALAATNVTVTAGYIDFGVQLDWTRSAGAPDQFEVWRDGKVIAKVEAEAVLLTSTTFRYIDRSNVRPRVAHTYLVRALVNGVASPDSSSVNFTADTNGIWLIDPIEGWRVHLLGDDGGSLSMVEVSEVKHTLSSTRPVKITQTLGGFAGSLTGRLIAHPNATFDQLMTHYYALKTRPSRTMRLVMSDLNIPVVVSNLNAVPTPNREIERVVSFDVEQDGELPFTAAV